MTPNRRKGLIAAFTALLVLTGGIIALTVWPETQPEPAETSPTPGAEARELIKFAREEVSSVAFTPLDGPSFSIRREAGDDGDVYLLDAAEAVFSGVSDTLSSMFYYAITLSYLTPVTEEADDAQLALFGLDKPAVSWRIKKNDGTTVDLMLGVESATGTGRYARKKNERKVFLLSETQTSTLTQTMEELYDLSFVPFPASTDDDQTWLLIEHCLLEKKNETIEVQKRGEDEYGEAVLGMSTYYLKQPFASEGNDYMIEKALLEPVTMIKPASIAALHPESLEPYGLDDPVKLTVTDEDGWSGVLLIGNYDSGLGGRYVMVEGKDAVLLDTAGNYLFLDASADYLRSTQIWIYEIEKIASVSFDLQGVSRELKIEHYPDGDPTLRGWLDDVELTELNARRLYIAVLRIFQNGAADIEIPQETPEYTVTLTFTDGGSDKIELYRINERQLLIVRNGENQRVFINQTNLYEDFLSRFEMLDAGEDIPRF